jgi:XTP/dITP diphosphohydrolase
MNILIATRNAHKVEEIRAILGPSISCHTLAEFPSAPEVIEDAPTFAGNAVKKAVILAKFLCQQPTPGPVPACSYVLADDSGLEVDALAGAPGVHSARFAAPSLDANSTPAANNAKLLRLLATVPAAQRTARFKCVVALTPVLPMSAESASPVCFSDEFEIQSQIFEGTCEGHILTEARGLGGFGYDPLFVPLGHDRTFAELGDDIKNRLSHRAQALFKMNRALQAEKHPPLP